MKWRFFEKSYSPVKVQFNFELAIFDSHALQKAHWDTYLITALRWPTPSKLAWYNGFFTVLKYASSLAIIPSLVLHDNPQMFCSTWASLCEECRLLRLYTGNQETLETKKKKKTLEAKQNLDETCIPMFQKQWAFLTFCVTLESSFHGHYSVVGNEIIEV